MGKVMKVMIIFLLVLFNSNMVWASSTLIEVTQKNWHIIHDALFYFSAEIKNTSNKTIDVEDIQVTALDKDGYILFTSTYFKPKPSILAPGEFAYLGGLSGGGVSHGTSKDIKELVVKVHPKIKNYKILQLQTDKVKVSSENFGQYSRLNISGYIINILNEEVKYTQIMFVFFDEDGNLVSIAKGETDTLIESKASLPFQFDIIFFPNGLAEKISTTKVIVEPVVFPYIY